MRWNSSMGPHVPEAEVHSEWRPKRVKGNEGMVLTSDSEPPRHARQEESRPVGLIWAFRDHSCGYDTTFTILSNLWSEDPNKWSAEFAYLGPMMGELAAALRSVVNGGKSLEQARNTVRRSMHMVKPKYFPYGPNTTSIDRIAEVLFPFSDVSGAKQPAGLLKWCWTAKLDEYLFEERTWSLPRVPSKWETLPIGHEFDFEGCATLVSFVPDTAIHVLLIACQSLFRLSTGLGPPSESRGGYLQTDTGPLGAWWGLN
ncbi:hypothetical protein B0H16DRAFT_1471827 [Mycena metata]|uniref:Uncharacterized protein n=1 Tax=Mycena metata TaxID=1033252 RepID=A0AAD7HPS9_9AGAR|nr:hypothetical protein B0H16DRAFT_1471827 [Mycena metata]